MALYDLDSNKPLPQYLRAFALPNPHPEVVTNFPLYYYTGGTVLDESKRIIKQNFLPQVFGPDEEPWLSLLNDIRHLEGRVWRVDHPKIVS